MGLHRQYACRAFQVVTLSELMVWTLLPILVLCACCDNNFDCLNCACCGVGGDTSKGFRNCQALCMMGGACDIYISDCTGVSCPPNYAKCPSATATGAPSSVITSAPTTKTSVATQMTTSVGGTSTTLTTTTPCETSNCNVCKSDQAGKCVIVRQQCSTIAVASGLLCVAASRGLIARLCAALAVLFNGWCAEGAARCSDEINSRCRLECSGCLVKRRKGKSEGGRSGHNVGAVRHEELCEDQRLVKIAASLKAMYVAVPDAQVLAAMIELNELCPPLHEDNGDELKGDDS
jgi:hypothetical protein